MNFKTTYILFGLLALMLVVLGVVLYSGPSAPPGQGLAFPTMKAKDKPLKADQIDKVVIQRKKPEADDIVFSRVDSTTWKITSPKVSAADSRQITGLVDQLMNAPIDQKADVPSVSRAGLDSPSRVISIHAGDRLWTLTIGDITLGTDSAVVYAQSSDLPGKTLVIPKSSLETALEGFEYFRAKELLGENTNDIRSIKFTHSKKPVVELKKVKDRWTMPQPSSGDIDIGELPTQLANLRVDHTAKTSDFVKDGVTDLAEYGLDARKADVVRIDVTREIDGKTTTTSALIGVGKKVAEKSYYVAFDADGKTKDVAKVSVASVEPILKWVEDPSAFRSKNLLALESFRQPDAILIKNSFGDLEFFRTDDKEPWILYRGTTANGVDPVEVRKLIDELNKKGAVLSFPDPKRRKELGLEKPDVIVRVYSDGLEKADAKKPGKPVLKKDAIPVAELRFGIAEGPNVAVERIWGDEKTIVMVPQSLLDQVRKGPLGYFDRSIPPFNSGSPEENVTKIELTRDGQTHVVTRANATAPWKLEQPAAFKGRTAGAGTIREILGQLNGLTAREIVTEKADAKELTNYNLVTPPVKVVVTVTKEGKPTTTTFDFGTDTGARGVYLKISGKDAVYLVGGDTLLPLKKELRDTSVFSFDPTMVTTLKVTGWAGLVGSPISRTFDQKNGVWTMKETGTLDPSKVAALVAGLSRLELDRFVPAIAVKGMKPEEDALQIEITLADKSVLELTVGAADGAGYFATSKQSGDTFVVGKALFEKVREKPAYFAK